MTSPLVNPVSGYSTLSKFETGTLWPSTSISTVFLAGMERAQAGGKRQDRLRDADLRRAVRFREPLLLRRLEERFFFAPPSCLLTVRHARSSASPLLTPRLR